MLCGARMQISRSICVSTSANYVRRSKPPTNHTTSSRNPGSAIVSGQRAKTTSSRLYEFFTNSLSILYVQSRSIAIAVFAKGGDGASYAQNICLVQHYQAS